jgi:hypothetical protein
MYRVIPYIFLSISDFAVLSYGIVVSINSSALVFQVYAGMHGPGRIDLW